MEATKPTRPDNNDTHQPANPTEPQMEATKPTRPDNNDTQRLADLSAIRDLAVRYCSAVDRRDWDLLAEVFTPGATVHVHGSGLMSGTGEIVSRYRQGLTKLDATHHMVTNHEIAVGGDSAQHSCLVRAQHVRHDAPGGPNYVIGGRYTDQLVRTEQGWRFKHRELATIWTEGNPSVLSLRPRSTGQASR